MEYDLPAMAFAKDLFKNIVLPWHKGHHIDVMVFDILLDAFFQVIVLDEMIVVSYVFQIPFKLFGLINKGSRLSTYVFL